MEWARLASCARCGSRAVRQTGRPGTLVRERRGSGPTPASPEHCHSGQHCAACSSCNTCAHGVRRRSRCKLVPPDMPPLRRARHTLMESYRPAGSWPRRARPCGCAAVKPLGRQRSRNSLARLPCLYATARTTNFPRNNCDSSSSRAVAPNRPFIWQSEVPNAEGI